MADKDEYFLELAKKEALKSKYVMRVGAIIVRKGTVVGRGFNQLRHTSKAKTAWPSVHAEVAAILSTSKRLLKKSTIYVYRIKKDGTQGLSKPCAYSTAMILFLSLKTIVYTTEEYYQILNTKDIT